MINEMRTCSSSLGFNLSQTNKPFTVDTAYELVFTYEVYFWKQAVPCGDGTAYEILSEIVVDSITFVVDGVDYTKQALVETFGQAFVDKAIDQLLEGALECQTIT